MLLSSSTALLSVGLTACTNAPKTQAASGEAWSEAIAQNPTPGSGVEHGTMQHDAKPPMQGMDHSSMNMNLGPKDESFDLRFIDAMIPHHEGAVVMAQEALQKSNRAEIRQLAQSIIDAQEQEIAQMKAWRSNWYPNAGEQPVMYSAEMGHTMPMTPEMRSSMMMEDDLGAADAQFDLRFLNAMIPHHQGAIDMANQALQNSDRPEIKTLAQDILTSQQQEIDQMNQWKQRWYEQ